LEGRGDTEPGNVPKINSGTERKNAKPQSGPSVPKPSFEGVTSEHVS